MQPGTGENGIRKIEITYGMTVQEVGEQLRKEGVISSVWGFRFHMRRQGMDRFIQTGTFYIPADVSVSEVSEMITRPEGRHSEVRIYPGFTIEQIAEIFSSRITGTDSEQFLEAIHREAEARGYPLPRGSSFPGITGSRRIRFQLIGLFMKPSNGLNPGSRPTGRILPHLLIRQRRSSSLHQ